MKNIVKALSLIVLSAASLPALAATEVSARPAGQQPVGVISESVTGGNLNELLSRLDAKAAAQGAGSYRVVSAGGHNVLFGTAELYK